MTRDLRSIRTVSARQARDNFGDLLGSVYYAKEAVVVEKQGKPVAVLISPEAYQRLREQDEQQARERIRQAAARIGERNRDQDPETVLAAVTEVVEEVRQQRYERERTKA